MRVLVCGTRDPQNEEAAREAIRTQFEAIDRLAARPHTLIHGNARGIDQLAESEAIRMGFAKGIYRFPAEWDFWKKRAGMLRNNEMLHTLKPDIVLAFPGPNSRGTYGMVKLAMAMSDLDVLTHKVD